MGAQFRAGWQSAQHLENGHQRLGWFEAADVKFNDFEKFLNGNPCPQ